MTTTDHDEKTTPATTPTEEPTADVTGRDRRFLNAGNIATAVAFLGLSVVCGTLLPLPIYRVLAGVAVVVAVVSGGVLLYRKFGESYGGHADEQRKPKHTS